MPVWSLDTTHSVAQFSAKHMMITTVRGTIGIKEGKIDFDPANPSAASVEATLDTTTLASGDANRDGHLKSPDFLDVANFPTITFKSTGVVAAGENKARVTGDLTVRDVTRPITLDVEFLGVGKNPFDQTERAGFEATATFNREDFGLNWNVALEAGGWLVGKEVKLNLEVEAVKVTETVPA
jgi:polyisoprenoid-binding protein YceI